MKKSVPPMAILLFRVRKNKTWVGVIKCYTSANIQIKRECLTKKIYGQHTKQKGGLK